MEIKHLHSFRAVAEALSFINAARKLHISQPALSAQIQALEAELGVQLLERTRRSVRLTKRVAAGESRHLKIGFVASAARACFSPQPSSRHSNSSRVTYPDRRLFG